MAFDLHELVKADVKAVLDNNYPILEANEWLLSILESGFVCWVPGKLMEIGRCADSLYSVEVGYILLFDTRIH